MSIYATIKCNCYDLGLYHAPPPFPDDLYVDDSGYPALGLPHNEATKAHFAQFDEWLRTCCEHPYMHLCHVRLSSGAGYFGFLAALDAFGWKYLPVLRRSLPWPERNFRSMKPDMAEKALQEVAYFRQKADFGENSFVVDSETGEVISEYERERYSVLHTLQNDGQHGTRIAFNERGIYIIQRPEGARRNRVVFQAKQLEQHLLEQPESRLECEHTVEFTNLKTGRKFACKTPISRAFWGDDAKIHLRYPRYLHVEKRRVDAAYFDYILKPLVYALEKCVESGNPIVWQEAW